MITFFVKNLRGFDREARIRLAPVTLMLGPNSGGKSTLLRFLNHVLKWLPSVVPGNMLGSTINTLEGEWGIGPSSELLPRDAPPGTAVEFGIEIDFERLKERMDDVESHRGEYGAEQIEGLKIRHFEGPLNVPPRGSSGGSRNGCGRGISGGNQNVRRVNSAGHVISAESQSRPSNLQGLGATAPMTPSTVPTPPTPPPTPPLPSVLHPTLDHNLSLWSVWHGDNESLAVCRALAAGVKTVRYTWQCVAADGGRGLKPESLAVDFKHESAQDAIQFNYHKEKPASPTSKQLVRWAASIMASFSVGNAILYDGDEFDGRNGQEYDENAEVQDGVWRELLTGVLHGTSSLDHFDHQNVLSTDFRCSFGSPQTALKTSEQWILHKLRQLSQDDDNFRLDAIREVQKQVMDHLIRCANLDEFNRMAEAEADPEQSPVWEDRRNRSLWIKSERIRSERIESLKKRSTLTRLLPRYTCETRDTLASFLMDSGRQPSAKQPSPAGAYSMLAALPEFLETYVFGTEYKASHADERYFGTDIIHLGPLRPFPPRTFLSPDAANLPKGWDKLLERLVAIASAGGSNTATLDERLQQLGLGHIDYAALDPEQRHYPTPYEIRFFRDGDENSSNIRDMGTGYSQVLPVILALDLAQSRGGWLLVEQPELHLHPKLQTILAKFLPLTGEKSEYLDDEGTSYCFIAETHSEHLVLGLLQQIQQRQMSEENLSLNWVDMHRHEDGVKLKPVKEIRVDERGCFLDPWPEGFFEESVDLSLIMLDEAFREMPAEVSQSEEEDEAEEEGEA